MSQLWLYLRLAAATAIVLAPGWAIARTLGVRGAAATLAWSLVVVGAALGVVVVIGTGIGLALVLVLAVGALAAVISARRRTRIDMPDAIPRWGLVAGAGVVLGVALWAVAGEIGGDGLFHLARVRKLDAFGDLSLAAVSEFPDGGLHPGYAFPLWHAFLALVSRIAFADPAEVVLHEASILAPIAVLVAFEAGYALFRRVWAAGAVAAASVAIVAMAPGHGGAYTALALPATASRQLLVPAALALAFAAIRQPRGGTLASVAAASVVLAIVHPTYALFLWIPFAGFLAVRWLWARADGRAGLLVLGALVGPATVVFLALLPVIRDTASVAPDADERARSLAQYAGQLNVRSPDSYGLAPELFGRSGAVAVAALLLIPLTGLAARRRWSAYVAGGSVALLVLLLLPALFTPFSDVVSISQARRAAGFVPFAFALAGGLGVLARLLGRLVVPVALAAGIAFQLLYPGDFDYVLTDGGPAAATWVALVGGVAAIVVGAVRRGAPLERPAALAAALFLAPVYLHGVANWSESEARPRSPLSPGLVEALRERAAGDTVFSDPEASYRIAAYAPVYVCVAPPGHVADTKANRPRERVEEFRRFARTGDLAIPGACGATWIVVDRDRFDTRIDLPVAYRDDRWVLYAVPTT